jgi:hypothetical protein
VQLHWHLLGLHMLGNGCVHGAWLLTIDEVPGQQHSRLEQRSNAQHQNAQDGQ